MDIPEVPTATLTINSLSPTEQTSIDKNSSLSVTYSWQIEKYDASKRYAMQILLYDTNTESASMTNTFTLNSATGTTTSSYSGQTFYNCFFGCVRKAALPFRLYFTVEKLDTADAQFGTTLARTREYIYN
jgi:hypothetical protein